MNITRYDLENSQRCRELRRLTGPGGIEPRRFRFPCETRRRIEQAVPDVLLDGPGAINKACDAYETDVEKRGAQWSTADSSTADAFQREKMTMYALLYAISKRQHFGAGYKVKVELCGKARKGRYRFGSILYTPSPMVVLEGSEGLITAVYRVYSSFHDEEREYLAQDLSLYADLAAAQQGTKAKIAFVALCPIVMGSKKKVAGYKASDGGLPDYYDNPFTRHYRDRSTARLAWSATFNDPAGNSKRLGKTWDKQALNTPLMVRKWVDTLDEYGENLQSGAGNPFTVTFPPPQILHAKAFENTDDLLDLAAPTNSPRNWRACRFPDRCPMHEVCWEGAAPDGPDYIKRS